MPKAARLGDIGSGHGCFTPSPAIEGSSDIIINGKPAVRVGDAYAAHGCNSCIPHPRNAAKGSSTVNFNGRPAVRVGDGINCGGEAQTGSGNVFIGDESWTGLPYDPPKPILTYQLTKYPGSTRHVRKQEPYKLYKDGAMVQQGLSDDDGLIYYEYEPPLDASTMEVEVELQRFKINIQAFAPPETKAGVEQRLMALGYNCFEDTKSENNADITNEGRIDARWLQSDDDEEADGSINESIIKKLKGLIP